MKNIKSLVEIKKKYNEINKEKWKHKKKSNEWLIESYNKKLYFYNNYHKNNINKLLHLIGIPMIVWSTFLGTHKFKIYRTRLSFVLYLIYSYYYVKMNKYTGSLSVIFYYLIYNNSLNLYKKIKNNNTKIIKYVGLTQLLAWFMQFFGHKYFENNKPALFKGFKDSFTIAPLFVIEHLNTYLITMFLKFLLSFR